MTRLKLIQLEFLQIKNMNILKVVEHNNRRFLITESKKKTKKYDVYENLENEIKFVLSFGSRKHQHYIDLIGLYRDGDHVDRKRLKAFDDRFEKLIKKNIDNPNSAMFWSKRYLWSIPQNQNQNRNRRVQN